MRSTTFIILGLLLLGLPAVSHSHDSGGFPVTGQYTQDNPPVDIPRNVADMVMFLRPDVEKVKNRNTTAMVKIDYPLGKTDVIANYGNNANELRGIDSLLRNISDNKLVTIGTIVITGHSSPDGKNAANERISAARAEGFRKCLESRHNLKDVEVITKSIGEDWDGVVKALEISGPDYRDEVLAVIVSTTDLDDREKKIKALRDGQPYREMLHRMFPALRRIGVAVAYTVSQLTDDQARELLYTNPEMLSLMEMIRVAEYYQPGSEQYRQVYETAAKHFPDDIIAANNAAAAALLDGDTAVAARYLEGIDDPRASVNRGVISYISGDWTRAEQEFTRAANANIEKGRSNLELLRREMAERECLQTSVQTETVTVTVTEVIHDVAKTVNGYRFAVKTNLMEWAGIFPDFSGLRSGVNFYGVTPNLEAEWFITRRWSLMTAGSWAGFRIGSSDLTNRWGYSTISLEPRVWFNAKRPNTGFFAGVYGSVGQYNLFFDGMKYAESGDLYSGGLSVGYAAMVTRHLMIEIGVRGGYASADNFLFPTDPYDKRYKVSTGTVTGFRLQSLKLSIGYRFGK